jgi:uncharacterized protein
MIMIRNFTLILLSLCIVLSAETELVDPQPTIVEPRQIVLSIGSGEAEEIHHVLGSANNILKFYGPEKVEMVIIAYYKGIRAVLKTDRDIMIRVKALQLYGVEFIACGNTMRTKGIKESQLLEDVEIVTAGLVEMIERQKSGWINITP